MIHDQIRNACRLMLAPIVRILLRNGITWREFSDISKLVYVEIARSDYGVQGRPTNVARVSMMTGISRREVTRVRDTIEGQRPATGSSPNRISAILSAWHIDPEFLSAQRTPRILPRTGKTASLDSLLTRFAGDLPHGALTKELLQLGLISETDKGFQVMAREYVRSASDPNQLDQAAIALKDHGDTLAFNLDSERKQPARFERMASIQKLDRRYLNDFHAHVSDTGQKYLEDIDTWLSSHAASGSTEESVRVGLGMFLIQDKT